MILKVRRSGISVAANCVLLSSFLLIQTVEQIPALNSGKSGNQIVEQDLDATLERIKAYQPQQPSEETLDLVDINSSPFSTDEFLDAPRKRVAPSILTWFPPVRDKEEEFFDRKSRFYVANEYVKRRLCILPTMSCNLRPHSCCPGTTCRCNLWGQNCRCLRMGIFQRWGK